MHLFVGVVHACQRMCSGACAFVCLSSVCVCESERACEEDCEWM